MKKFKRVSLNFNKFDIFSFVENSSNIDITQSIFPQFRFLIPAYLTVIYYVFNLPFIKGRNSATAERGI